MIKFNHGNYFFKKGGGTTLEKGGGEPTPCSPPPKSALATILRKSMVTIMRYVMYIGLGEQLIFVVKYK